MGNKNNIIILWKLYISSKYYNYIFDNLTVFNKFNTLMCNVMGLKVDAQLSISITIFQVFSMTWL